jgi:hypothetical protein
MKVTIRPFVTNCLLWTASSSRVGRYPEIPYFRMDFFHETIQLLALYYDSLKKTL